MAQKLRAAIARWLSGITRPVPEAVLSLPHCRQRFSKSTLPHCSFRITPYRAPVSMARVTNGTRERERDFPQACSSADSSSGVMARPMSSLKQIREAQDTVMALSENRTPESGAPDVTAFVSSLATAWRAGEVRPTHRREPKSGRWWRTRKDPFAENHNCKPL